MMTQIFGQVRVNLDRGILRLSAAGADWTRVESFAWGDATGAETCDARFRRMADDVEIDLPDYVCDSGRGHRALWVALAGKSGRFPWRSATLVDVSGDDARAPEYVLAVALDGSHGGWGRGSAGVKGRGYFSSTEPGIGEWVGRVEPTRDPIVDVEAVALGRTGHSATMLSAEHVAGAGSLVVRADWAAIAPLDGTEIFDPLVIATLESGAVVRFPLPVRSGVPLDAAHVRRDGHVVHIDPYRTFRASRLAVRTTALTSATHAVIEEFREAGKVRDGCSGDTARPLWVVGETAAKGQDTAFHLFRYLVDARPDIDARFVIDADSPDRSRVEALGPVLVSGTPEHACAVLRADRIVSSHHPDYLYPVRSPWFRDLIKAPRIFIQHGVLGTKWMANLYGRGVGDFEVDHVLVSSEREKRIMVRDLGYARRQVTITGLSRFDSLLSPGSTAGTILVAPTWRDWIVTHADLRASDFFAQWRAFLQSDELTSLAAATGFSVHVMLHPNFGPFVHEFDGLGVTVVNQGEVSVHDALRAADVLVTDYSSVGFDFALQDKPVLYFQFDRERFLGAEGSHLDLDAELPGVVTTSLDGARKALRDMKGSAPLRSTPLIQARARRFFPAMDRGSNERIVATIEGVARQWPGASRPRWDRRVRRVAGRFVRAVKAVATRH